MNGSRIVYLCIAPAGTSHESPAQIWDLSSNSRRALAGTTLDMATAVRNCVKLVQVFLPDALRFASTHPAEFIGLGQILGRLAPGIAIDAATFPVLGTWVAGAYKAAH